MQTQTKLRYAHLGFLHQCLSAVWLVYWVWTLLGWMGLAQYHMTLWYFILLDWVVLICHTVSFSLMKFNYNSLNTTKYVHSVFELVLLTGVMMTAVFWQSTWIYWHQCKLKWEKLWKESDPHHCGREGGVALSRLVTSLCIPQYLNCGNQRMCTIIAAYFNPIIIVKVKPIGQLMSTF